MNSIVDALLLLKPFDIDKPKIRLGPRGDGGYIFVDDFSPDQPVISYGVGAECQLDLEFAQRGHQVYMFDHTIAGIETRHPGMHFFAEGVAGQSDSAGELYSIADHLVRHKIHGDRIIMKIDVEGAEFEALLAAPDYVFARLAQLVIEVHDLHLLAEDGYRGRFFKMFQKINHYCTLFHVHANNCDGPNTFYGVGGLPVTRIIELSYVRTASVNRRPSQTLYPTALDFPNTPQRDKLLWTFPFLPDVVQREEFSRSADNINSSSDCLTEGPSTSLSSWEQLEVKEAELQRIVAASIGWREQLELKEAELQRISTAAAGLHDQMELKEAELQRISAAAVALRDQLELKEAELQRISAAAVG